MQIASVTRLTAHYVRHSTQQLRMIPGTCKKSGAKKNIRFLDKKAKKYIYIIYILRLAYDTPCLANKKKSLAENNGVLTP